MLWRKFLRLLIVTASLFFAAAPVRAACNITGIQSITGLSANLGTYNAGAPVTQTLTLTVVLDKVGNGVCTGALAFQSATVPAQMSGPGIPKLDYTVTDTGGSSILYTTIHGTSIPISGTNNNLPTLTVTVQINVSSIGGQLGRPSGTYSDSSVIARVFNGASSIPVGGAAPALLVSATVVTSCTISGTPSPAADNVTIPVSANGVVTVAPINRSYANVVCSSMTTVQVTSLSGAVKRATAPPSGFTNLIDYTASATFASATATLNTATIAGAVGPESGTSAMTSSSTPSGSLLVTITPQTPSLPLATGSYADTLRITVTPQ